VDRKFRLKKQTDFQRVRRFGKSHAHPLIVLVRLPNEIEQTRIGVAAGRVVGGAVQRNRAKRRLRGVLNPIAGKIATGWDLVFIARKPILHAGHQDLEQAVHSLLRKSSLID
jgi:ribonuclease P protein component